MKLIDADALLEVLRNSHESHAQNSREESLLARDIRLVKEQAKYHSIVPEEMKPLIDKTIEILPQLTDAIVENLPRVIEDMDICQDCEYRQNKPAKVCGNNKQWCESCVSKGKCEATRPQGRWILDSVAPHSVSWFRCSYCGNLLESYKETNYCPNCGAEMRKECAL